MAVSSNMACNTLPLRCHQAELMLRFLPKTFKLYHTTVTVVSLPESYFHLMSFHPPNYGYSQISNIDCRE